MSYKYKVLKHFLVQNAMVSVKNMQHQVPRAFGDKKKHDCRAKAYLIPAQDNINMIRSEIVTLRGA